MNKYFIHGCLLKNIIEHICNEFINSTNIAILYKEGSDMVQIVSSIIDEFIKHFKTTEVDVICITYINAYYFTRCLTRIIMFFSLCYEENIENNNPHLLHKKLNETMQPGCLYSVEHMICLWCFISLKDILSIDERIICIPEYIDYSGNIIPSKTYQNIVDDFYNVLYIRHNSSTNYLCLKFIHTLNPDHVLSIIKQKIEDNRQQVKFVSMIYKYDEFDYFININNPRKGMLTYLRFL